MAYDKNKFDRLRIQFAEEETRGRLNIMPDVEELISPRDALEYLCRQRKSNFKEFGRLFSWFIKEKDVYAISRNIFVDVDELKTLSHEEIVGYFKGLGGFYYQQFNELGTNFHFFNKIESHTNVSDERSHVSRIDDISDTLYEVISTKMDHKY